MQGFQSRCKHQPINPLMAPLRTLHTTLLSTTWVMTSSVLMTFLFASPVISSQPPPASLSAGNDQLPAMNVSTLGGAMFLLSSMYISLVQPESAAKPKVSMQFISPIILGETKDDFLKPFLTEKNNRFSREVPLEATPLATITSKKKIDPGEVLAILCNETFSENVITVLHINNPDVSGSDSSESRYLLQLLQSVGLPIISWDSDFSSSRQHERMLQLAPTMYHQTEAMLAFLKKFSWPHFSVVTTAAEGNEDFIASIRSHVLLSQQQASLNSQGQTGFRFEILSEVTLKDAKNNVSVISQLRRMAMDTRIILLHCNRSEAKDIFDAATSAGYTGREYVWVMTASAHLEGHCEHLSASYPIGAFAVDFKNDREEMKYVKQLSVKVLWSALHAMHRDDRIKDVQWNTRLSCSDKRFQRWEGGQLLFEFLKNVTIAADRDRVRVAFSDSGMTLYNRITIMNVIQKGQEDFNRECQKQIPPGFRPSLASSLSLSSHLSPKVVEDDATVGSSLGHSNFGSRNASRSLDRFSGTGAPRERFGTGFNRFGTGGATLNSSVETRSFLRQGSGMQGKSQASEIATHERFGTKDGVVPMPLTEGTGSPSALNPISYFERRSRDQKTRRHLLRHHRFSRSTREIRLFYEVGIWDGNQLKMKEIVWPGNSTKPPSGFPERYHLKVVTYIEAPHVTFRNFSENGKCDIHATTCMVYERDENDNRIGNTKVERCCSGLSIDLLQHISQELQFDFDLFEVESGGYGSPLEPNETEWSGVVGALMSGKADVSVAALSITPEREQVIDFSVPFLETGITIVVAIREGAISPTAFLEPYDYPSWTLILVFSVHATGASIFIFEWLSPYGLDQGKTPLRVHKFSLFRSFWLIWAMLFGAAVSTDMPRGVSSRFLANIWALFAVVFLASYTANLAAFMITKEEYYDLSGIQDWRLKNPHHRQPPFKYATMPNGSTELNIRKNHPDLYAYMKKYPQHTVKEAVSALKKQTIQAFIYDATTLEYAVGKDPGCKLKSVGKRYAETGYGVGFQRDSQWVKKFNEVLLRMQDEGEIERLQKYWLAGACHKKSKQRGSSSHTLGILNFTSAFILLGGGVVLGAILLMVEHAYFRFGRNSLRKWDKCGCCSLVSLSMGQSLTFEQSVMEAIDLHKHHKCKDPLCETQLWKAKHELDIALLRIDQLRRLLAKQMTASDGDDTVWTYNPDATRQKNGVPRKRLLQSAAPSTQDSKSPQPDADRNGAKPLGVTTLTSSPRARKSSPPRPSSFSNDSDLPPTPRGPRRTKLNEGKIYENVDGGIDIESSI